MRDGRFISTAADHPPEQLVPCPLLLCPEPELAWGSSTIDQALERAALLRFCWGLNTEIRALR